MEIETENVCGGKPACVKAGQGMLGKCQPAVMEEGRRDGGVAGEGGSRQAAQYPPASSSVFSALPALINNVIITPLESIIQSTIR